MNDRIGCRQVEPGSAGLYADQKNRYFSALKIGHGRTAVGGIAGKNDIRNFSPREFAFNQRKHTGKLGKR